jgi:hypothetical protein
MHEMAVELNTRARGTEHLPAPLCQGLSPAHWVRPERSRSVAAWSTSPFEPITTPY